MSIDEEYVNTTKYINILNELNIFYYLAFGSELADYRNGNKRKDDHDIDLNITVRKNYYKLQNTLAIVPSDPHPHLQLLYGNYLVPSYRQSSEGYNIHSPNTTWILFGTYIILNYINNLFLTTFSYFKMLMIYYSILLIRQYLRLLTNINISIKHYKIKLKIIYI